MKDAISLVHQFGDDLLIENGVDHPRELGILFQVLDVGEATGRQIIENGDTVAALQEPLAQVRANETGATGDQYMHENAIWLERFTDSRFPRWKRLANK